MGDHTKLQRATHRETRSQTVSGAATIRDIGPETSPESTAFSALASYSNTDVWAAISWRAVAEQNLEQLRRRILEGWHRTPIDGAAGVKARVAHLFRIASGYRCLPLPDMEVIR
jgi:hypothetical protein